jgi:hypothetical protein
MIRPASPHWAQSLASCQRFDRPTPSHLTLRRIFHSIVIAALVSAVNFDPLSSTAGAAEARKLNLLHINADDHRADGLHALGNGLLQGKSTALVYLMDLFPTLVDYAGARLPSGVEGKSLRPVIEGKTALVRTVLYTGYKDVQRAVRDQRWKLIRYPLVNQTQLFDLQTDPHELRNLATQPESADKIAELTALLQNEMRIYGDAAPLEVTAPISPAWTPPTADQLRKEAGTSGPVRK